MSRHSGAAWWEGREVALNRDEKRCQDCGRKNHLHVHHIKPPEDFNDPERGHHPSNLVTLCKYCHNQWEGVQARPILIGDAGLNLSEVVESLAADTITEISIRYAADDVYEFFVHQNAGICSRCFKLRGGHRVVRQLFERAVWREVQYVTDNRREPKRLQEVRYSRPTVTDYCPECVVKYDDKSDIRSWELLQMVSDLSERLLELGVDHDEQLLRPNIREWKYETGSDIDAASRGVADAMRGKETPQYT